MAAFLARVKNFRAGGNTLQADLKKITDSGITDIPTELLDTIVEASSDEANRREIMTYLRECLAGPTPAKQWRRLYSALVLIEDIMRRGDRLLVHETAEGHHFDVVQRLSFLEHYDNPDKRAQGLVKEKASTLRSELVPKLQNASGKDLEDVRSEPSTCSPSVTSSRNTVVTDTSYEAEKRSCGSADSSPHVSPMPLQSKPTGRMVLNGIVSVGHNEDTTDDSSEDEASTAPVQYRQAKPWKQANLDKEEPRAGYPPEEPRAGYPQASSFGAPQTSVQTMDLLDL